MKLIRHLIPANKLWGEQGCTFVCSSLNNETKRNSSGMIHTSKHFQYSYRMNTENVLIIHE